MIFLGFLTGFVGSLLGWQINIIALHRGIEKGKFAALFVGLGAVIADLIFIAIALTGTLPILHHKEWWLPMKFVAISVIVFISLKILLQKNIPKEKKPLSKRNPTKNFIIGFLFVITNPAVFFIWLGVTGFILTHFSSEQGIVEHLFFLIGFLWGAVLWFFILSVAFVRWVRQWGEEKFFLFSKFFAFLLLIAAIILMFEKIG